MAGDCSSSRLTLDSTLDLRADLVFEMVNQHSVSHHLGKRGEMKCPFWMTIAWLQPRGLNLIDGIGVFEKSLSEMQATGRKSSAFHKISNSSDDIVNPFYLSHRREFSSDGPIILLLPWCSAHCCTTVLTSLRVSLRELSKQDICTVGRDWLHNAVL